MPSPKLAELKEGETFEGFYAVRESALHTTVGGKFYIRLTLADSSLSLLANIWDATQEQYHGFAVGDVVKVRGVAESYKGRQQAKILQLRVAHASEVENEEFLPSTPRDTNTLRAELRRLVASVGDRHYRALLEAFFGDDSLLDRFARAPAAKENHHACLGGLMEHSVAVARLAEGFAAAQPDALDRDLLVAGALLHDIGKVDELSATTTIDYTDVGRLVGHLVIGCLMVEARTSASPAFPIAKKWAIQHLILSHHGRREYGSPVLPATPEALALHHLDNLDAKVAAANRLIAEDPDPLRRWTERSWMLETPLYKGL